MADIQFKCPHCGKDLQIDAAGAGMQVSCPGCGGTLAVPSAAAAASATGLTPASVTVFGILNIVFGGFGILCSPFGMIGAFVLTDTFNRSPGYKAWLMGNYVVGFACAIWLLSLGIGLLRLRRWARTGSIAYGGLSIALGVLGMLVNFGLLATGGLDLPPEAQPGFIGGTIGGLIGLIYPILLIVFMRRPAAETACVK